jgi:hypothetical protein
MNASQDCALAVWASTGYSVSAADWTTLSSVMRLVHTVEACDVRASWHGEGGGFEV